MHPLSSAQFESVISKPRLASYKTYFQADTDESIGLYMWNCELTAGMGTLLALFEIALRNGVHREMSRFQTRNQPQVRDSHHWYDQMQLPPGTQKKVSDLRQRFGNPSPDEIVSGLSFGFWPAVLKAIPSNRGILEKIFPHHPYSISAGNDWHRKAKHKAALAFIYELNDFRNRVAHHEPLWKFGAINNATVQLPGSTNEAESLVRLIRILGFIDNAIYWISPALQADMANSSWRRKLNFLLTPRGVQRYRNREHVAVPPALDPPTFSATFASLVAANRPVYIRQDQIGGIFIPD